MSQRTARESMASSGLPTGSVQMFAGGTAPAGWLLCDGSAVSRTTYARLFAVINTTYGSGDTSTTFNLPDLRGRSPIGAGAGTGLATRAAGTIYGAESATITTAMLPAHGHGVTGVTVSTQDLSHTHPPGTYATSNFDASHTHSLASAFTDYANAPHTHNPANGGSFIVNSSTGVTLAGVASGTVSWGQAGTDSQNANHRHALTGSTAGASVTLLHNHTVNSGASGPANPSLATHTHTLSGTTDNTGGGGTVPTITPSLGINFIIKV